MILNTITQIRDKVTNATLNNLKDESKTNRRIKMKVEREL